MQASSSPNPLRSWTPPAAYWLVLTWALVPAAACGREGAPEPATAPVAEVIYTPRPLRDITVPRTPERVARGKYLSEGLLQCFVCHSERDWTKPGAPPFAANAGTGAVWPGRPWLVAPNLTPDEETGIGRWTDDMLLRAIREGISHDGRVLHPQMWYASFRSLPDVDAESVVAYLRTLKPIRRVLQSTMIPPDEAKRLRVPRPITEPVTAAPPLDEVQRGLRLIELADCSGCHTSWYTPTNPGMYGGGNLVSRGDVKSYGANLTRDPSGIPHYDAALFREVMRTGRVKGRDLSPVMPWIVFKNLSDADLDAMFAVLRALTPVKHVIDNIAPPTACKICGGTHPLGEYNRPREFKPVDFDLSLVADAVGTYRFESGWQITLVIERRTYQGQTFRVRFDDGNTCELLTEDRKTFACEGDVDRIEIVRDSAGKVTHILNLGVAIGLKVAR
jgi:mono/diheme cytochrome c family protein